MHGTSKSDQQFDQLAAERRSSTTEALYETCGNRHCRLSEEWTPMTMPGSSSLAIPAEFGSLYKYLRDRYADTVVLTFAQMEDLLGFALPDTARVEQAWWANAADRDSPSPQSLSWMRANRTATPRLSAQVVVFERTSG